MNRINGTGDGKWIALVLAGLCSLPPAASAQIRLGASSFSANGEVTSGGRPKAGYRYTGPCPVDLRFEWGIISTDPTDMVYSFARNDGGQSKPARTSMPGGDRSFPVVDGWRLGDNSDQFANFRGWVELDIRSPYPLTYRIPFTLQCVGADDPADQTAGVDGAPASDSDGVQASDAPPPLPDYDQPPCPEDGYLWAPGYWGFGPGRGYFWVPGTWVAPPQVGVLWTPGYWGSVGGMYAWHAGYWGPHVGFYGGVNYGFGYGGHGFAGGRWNGGRFAYNTAITHINTTIIHNTYRETIVNNTTINNVALNRTSFNGGPKGITAKPTAEDNLALKDFHLQGDAKQMAHFTAASKNPTLYAKANGGHPGIAATARPGDLKSVAATNGRAVQVQSAGKPLGHGDALHPTPPERVASIPQAGTKGASAHSIIVHPTTPTPSQVTSSPPHSSQTAHPPAQTTQLAAQSSHPAASSAHPVAQASHPAAAPPHAPAQVNQPQPQKKEPSHK